MILSIDAGTGFGSEVQLVSGPSGPPADFVIPTFAFRIDGGNYQVGPLVAASDYVIRARRTSLYNSTTFTLKTVTSDWATFRFSTPTLAASRPSAPVLRLGTRTADTVEVLWNPSTDNASTANQIRYTSTVDGVSRGLVCFEFCLGETALRIARPAAGTTVAITVTAIDDAGIESLPSAPLRVTG